MLETLVFALLLNLVMFGFAYAFRTDKLTDISYAATFVGIAAFGVFTNSMNLVKWLAVGVVVLWAVRLGTYLLIRIHAMGRDKRFDDKRDSFWKFGGFWLLQAVTAWIVMLPVTLLLNEVIVTGAVDATTTLFLSGGLLIAITGLVIEAVADQQKFMFISNKKNKNKWIASGLWKYSRHPNYFGEMTVWWGVFLYSCIWLSVPQMVVGLASPLFIMTMLLFVSGVPLLEKSADKKWGKNKNYQAYKKRTNLLIPLPRR